MSTTKGRARGKKAKRRKKGTGSIRPHGRGYEAAITIVIAETGEKKRLTPTFATEEEADTWLNEQVLNIRRGRSRELLGIPFVRLVEEYLKHRRLEMAAGDIGQAQLNADEGRITNHLLPYFKDKLVNEMSVHAIETYLKEKVAGLAPVALDPEDGTPLAQTKLAPSTVKKHIANLNGMFKLAQKLMWTLENPVTPADKPKLEPSFVEALTLNEVRKLLILIPAEKRNLTLVQLHLGLRSGEARGIRNHDIIFNSDGGGELRVRGAVKRVDIAGGDARLAYVKRLKTLSGWRNIPFGAEFGAILEDQIAIAADRPDPDHEDLIFRTSTGRPLSGDNYRNQVYMPAVSAALFKLMTDGQRRRLLNSVPEDLTLVTELLALDDVGVDNVLTATWDDYDLSRRVLNYTDGDGRRRIVEVPPAMHDRLLQHKHGLEKSQTPNRRNYLFPGKKSMQIRTQSFLSAVFREAWKEASMGDDRRLHRLRHTYASAMAGEIELRDLQHFIGHRRMSTTADLYVHFYKRKNAPLGDTTNLYRDAERG